MAENPVRYVLLAGEEGGIGIEVAAEVAGEEACLEVGQHADGGFFVEERMVDFVLFAFLPGGEDGFAGIFLEEDGAVFLDVEIAEGDLLAVDEGKRGAVGEVGAEFLHEVEGQRRAAGAVAMQEPALGIETATFERAPAIVHEQCIEKGKQRVDGIERRSARAA